MKPAQAVTTRYANNLLRSGRNKEFIVASVERLSHTIQGVLIGSYYDAKIERSDGSSAHSIGVTPEEAVRRCLVFHGVTFR